MTLNHNMIGAASQKTAMVELNFCLSKLFCHFGQKQHRKIKGHLLKYWYILITFWRFFKFKCDNFSNNILNEGSKSFPLVHNEES